MLKTLLIFGSLQKLNLCCKNGFYEYLLDVGSNPTTSTI